MTKSNFKILIFIWSIYICYIITQYTPELKSSQFFISISLFYTIVGNSLWIYRSRQLNSNDTLKLALIWDSGINFLSFIIPVLYFGKNIELKVLIGMLFIFIGILFLLLGDKLLHRICIDQKNLK